MDALGISRRRLLQLGTAAAASLAWMAPLLPPSRRRPRALVLLDVDPDQLRWRTPEILDWAMHYRPQTNTMKPPWDPRRPNDPRNERLLKGDYGKALKASELAVAIPNTYQKAREVIAGIHRLQAAADERAIRGMIDSMLFTGLQVHTLTFDHPDQGLMVPEGWRWEWTLTVPHEVARRQRLAWAAAGWRLEDKPAIALARKRVAERGQPTGWLRANPKTRRAIQYALMPDLRQAACRAWLVERLRPVLAETRLRCLDVTLKSGWLHEKSSIRNTPEHPGGADPWLPSPYPGDSYRDASDAMVRDLAAALGDGYRILATNTAVPPKGSDPHLPDYVRTRHGGLADGPAGAVLDGYWGTILRLPKKR